MEHDDHKRNNAKQTNSMEHDDHKHDNSKQTWVHHWRDAQKQHFDALLQEMAQAREKKKRKKTTPQGTRRIKQPGKIISLLVDLLDDVHLDCDAVQQHIQRKGFCIHCWYSVDQCSCTT